MLRGQEPRKLPLALLPPALLAPLKLPLARPPLPELEQPKPPLTTTCPQFAGKPCLPFKAAAPTVVAAVAVAQ